MSLHRPTIATSDEHIAFLAENFGSTTDLNIMKEIAIELATPGATNKAAQLPAFRFGVRRVLDAAIYGGSYQRLAALALCARLLSQPSKELQSLLKDALGDKAPSIEALPSLLKDQQDREYLAQALDLSDFENKATYLAGFIAGEGQTSTKSRNLATSSLFNMQIQISAAFDLLGKQLKDLDFTTKEIGTSRARRLTRTLEAIERVVRTIDPVADIEAGQALARLIKSALNYEQISDSSAAIDLANATFGLLATILRSDFSAARNPNMFDSIEVVYKLFSPSTWPKKTENGRFALAQIIRQVLALLAPAGITDIRLRNLLILLVGKSSGDAILRKLATNLTGVSSDVRYWLEHGRARKHAFSIEVIGETILESIDRDLAEIYREVTQLEQTWGPIEENLSMLDEEVAPQFSRLLDIFAKRVFRLSRVTQSIASKRNFEMLSNVGEAVAYSPIEHEADVPLLGVRIVRIRNPQVIRRVEGPLQIVLKAKVDPV